jgi:hypothetical protein
LSFLASVESLLGKVIAPKIPAIATQIRKKRPNLVLADLEYESSFMTFQKPRLTLTIEYVQNWYSYFDSATPKN